MSRTPVKRKTYAPNCEETSSNKKRRIKPELPHESINNGRCYQTPLQTRERGCSLSGDASGDDSEFDVSRRAFNFRHRSLSIDSLPEVPRYRSRSIDAVPDSTFSSSAPPSSPFPGSGSSSSSRSHIPVTRRVRMDAVVISPRFSIPVPTYHPFCNELAETRGLQVPGEVTILDEDRPVRNLNNFTLYDHEGKYLPFDLIVRSLEKGLEQTVLASGVVTRRLEDPDDGDSDIEDVDTELLVSLQPLVDFWVDYDHDKEQVLHEIFPFPTEDPIHRSTVWIATQAGWYILQEPDPLYATFYQPFWAAHYLTWRIARATRQSKHIKMKDFLRQLQNQKDSQAKMIMGRDMISMDLENDYTAVARLVTSTHAELQILYILEQISLQDDSDELLATPLLQKIASRATERDLAMDDLCNLNAYVEPSASVCGPTPTVTMPIVHKLTTGIFLTTLLKAGKELNDDERRHELLNPPEPPDILHPDSPTNIEWEMPIEGAPDYFKRVYLDGEPYDTGDVVMVNPGEDDVAHRAKSAAEACSRSGNALFNKVWFCKIVYMYDRRLEKSHGIEKTAHVQWYQDGAKTILQETAHPYGLFALAECADVPVGSIFGRCNVQHLRPGDREPNAYHCSFLWDADDCRFLDQAVLASRQGASVYSYPYCPCCAFNEKRGNDAMQETLIHSNDHATVRGVHYHKDDFVYIAAKPHSPYLIGQIRRFFVDKEFRLEDTKVELTLFGRYDDVARAVEEADGQSELKKDELRLFMTGQLGSYRLPLLEGKCFVHSKKSAAFCMVGYVADHFFVDRWAKHLAIHDLADLKALRTNSIVACETCVNDAEREQQKLQDYTKRHSPLKTMELFAGAGGLSTGLEQSGFVKTCWAVEISPGAAATFQANHPTARVYNQDTNVCLQSAIDVEAGKPYKPLLCLSNSEQLPPMPRRGAVDLITGGFPCQSFSGMNHMRHKRPDDIRTTLVANLLSYVEFYQPQYVLMENVKGLLQHHIQGGQPDQDDDDDSVDGERVIKMGIVKFVLRALTCLGYQAQLRVLQAADYGSPQRRERVIFWGARRPWVLPDYPLPTHVATDYKMHILNLPTHDKLFPSRRSEEGCAPFRALVVADALSDLPRFDWKNPLPITSQKADNLAPANWTQMTAVSSATRSLVGFLEPVNYATSANTRYQRMMRGEQTQVTLHCSRTFGSIIVARVGHVCSDNVFGPRGNAELVRSFFSLTFGICLDIPRYVWTRVMLDASPSKLKKIWQQRFLRLGWKEPFCTALTSCTPFSKGGKILHPKQKRILTVRECARSQGFPDYYEFVQREKDANWVRLLKDIHKQIGNAVPVPLAQALGESLGKALVARWLQGKGSDGGAA